METELLGVFVGRPRPIGTDREGGAIVSAIGKRPVAAPFVDVGELNIEGDAQADLTVHGGVDKAVYAYAADHYEAWRAAGFDLEVGGVGENLAVAGWGEHDVRIGDVWAWGDARLQVSQPRAPCYKLAVHVGRRGAGAEMVRTGHSGWYLRVLAPGRAPTTGTIERVATDPSEPTVAEAFAVAFRRRQEEGGDGAAASRVVGSARLADDWRRAVLQ